MLTAVDPKSTIELSLPDDKKDPTVFLIRRLSGIELANVYALGKGDADNDTLTIRGVEALRLTLEYGLVGWRNFGGVEFTGNHRTDVARLDITTFEFLADKIVRKSIVDADTKKK